MRAIGAGIQHPLLNPLPDMQAFGSRPDFEAQGEFRTLPPGVSITDRFWNRVLIPIVEQTRNVPHPDGHVVQGYRLAAHAPCAAIHAVVGTPTLHVLWPIKLMLTPDERGKRSPLLQRGGRPSVILLTLAHTCEAVNITGNHSGSEWLLDAERYHGRCCYSPDARVITIH